MIYDDDGNVRRFGSAKNNDFLIYTLLKDPTAYSHRKSYLARATKIKGDWKKDKFSPNSLAISILW